MICDRCGTTVSDHIQTCHNCGHALQKGADRGTRQGTLVLRRQRRAKALHNLPYKAGDWIDDRYRIQDVVGAGALGGVFRVVDTDLDQELALKLISPTHLSPEIIRTLRQAMRRVRRLSHHNIVRVYDEGVYQDSYYYTMPFLEGLTLAKIIELRREKNQCFDLQEVEPILSQIVDALEYAHTTLFHGYLKPQNIVVLPDVLKLTGFGLALAIPFDVLLKAQENQPESLVYLAPELKEGRPCDARADIYSLGVLLGEMLTGRSNPLEIPSIQELNADVNPLIDVVFRRAIGFAPEDRYLHVADMMTDISNLLTIGELGEDDEVPTLIVGDEHALPMPDLEFDPDVEPELDLVIRSVHDEVLPNRHLMAPALPGHGVERELVPPPLPREESVVIQMSASMEVEAIDESELEHTTIPAELYEAQQGNQRKTVPTELQKTQPPANRPVVQFTGESEVYRLPTNSSELDSLLQAPVMQPPPLPKLVKETNPDSPPSVGVSKRGMSPFGVDPGRVGSELELPLDEDDTSPASPVPLVGFDTPLASYPEAAPTIPARMAPARTVPVEQTYQRESRVPAPMLTPPPLPEVVELIHSQPAHVQTHMEEDTSFSRLGIFLFFLAIFLIFGAGGTALYIKFVYLPRVQMERLKKEQNLPQLPPAKLSPTQLASAVPPRREQVPVGGRKVDASRETPSTRIDPRDPQTTPRLSGSGVVSRRSVSVSPAVLPEKRQGRTEPRTTRKAPPVVRRDVRKVKVVRRKSPKPGRRLVAAATGGTSGGRCPRGMAYLRKGGFLLGSAKSDEMRSFGEKSLLRQTTESYCIDRYEYPGPGRRPRTSVSFFSAQKICEQQGKRLCTEQEWERACKGGSNFRYPYGNKFDDQKCNTRQKSGENRSIAAGGSFRGCRSRYGIFDMSGNAAEWTSSSYSPGSSTRTVRGGAANRPDWDVRCASRRALGPSSSQATVGFRCCADPK